MGTLILIVFIFVLIIFFLIGISKQNSEFWIEHYPETGRYYPRYGKYYIHKDIDSGLLITKYDFISYALYSSTEEGAKEILERFKQDELKIGVKRIDL